MSLIEFCGMPRCGKTTFLESFGSSENITVHLERFDLNPYKHKDVYEYNLWYAEYVVQKVRRIQKDLTKVHIIERGILDRIAFGRALIRFDKFSSQQAINYLSKLTPLSMFNNFTFVFLIPPEFSLERIRSPEYTVTKDVHFLKLLFDEYVRLNEEFSNLTFFNEKNNTHDIEQRIRLILNN